MSVCNMSATVGKVCFWFHHLFAFLQNDLQNKFGAFH